VGTGILRENGPAGSHPEMHGAVNDYRAGTGRMIGCSFDNEKPSLKFVFFAKSALPPSKIHTLFASVAAGKYSAHCWLRMEDLNPINVA
jgi:hypothetical protein